MAINVFSMGLLVVFAILIILAVILIITKEKNSSPTDSIIPIEQSNPPDYEDSKSVQIIKENIEFMKQSDNINVLLFRRDIIEEKFNWIEIFERNGDSFKWLETNRKEINIFCNEMIAKMKDREEKENILNKTADINTKIRTAKRISHLDAIIFEGNRRLQIMRESTDLIEGTDNIQTLIRRKKVLDEELDWFGGLEKEDCPYHLTGGVANKRNETDILFNKMLYRIVKNTVDDYLLKIDGHKTEISKKNYTIKTYEIIELAKISLIKYASNYLENETEISKQFSIIEDKFSMT